MEEQKLIDLVLRAKEHDNFAMEELFKAYYADIIFVCRKYNLSEEDAADTAQETFIKAFTEIKTLNNAAKFPAWLMRIATNKSVNLLKHNKTMTMDTVSSDEMVLEFYDQKKLAEDIVIDNEVRDILSKMIEQLPVEQRITIFMYYYQDYSIKEIADFFGCSDNTVKSRLYYAKKALRVEAERLENKGVKLRTIAVLPFLYTLFSYERNVFACEIPDCVSVIRKIVATNTVTTTVTGAAKTGFLATAAGKMVIGAVAALTIGGIAATIILPEIMEGPNSTTSEVPTEEGFTDEENVSIDTESESEGNINPDGGLVYWCKMQDWKNVQGTYDGVLLTAKMQAPIDISRIDEYSSPYFWFPNGVNGQNAGTISEILESNEMQRPGGTTSIGTQTSFHEHWIDYDVEEDGIASIGIYNYTEERLPIKSCYENGWWYMELNYEAFGLSVENKNNDYQIERADALVKVLGKPTYILSYYGNLEINEGYTCYLMVYEFDEYVISINMTEFIMNEYDAHNIKIEEIKYYTKECWEQEKKEFEENDKITLQ